MALLVLDPSRPPGVLREALRRGTASWPRLVKRGLNTLAKPAYQVLVLGGDDARKVLTPRAVVRGSSGLRLEL